LHAGRQCHGDGRAAGLAAARCHPALACAACRLHPWLRHHSRHAVTTLIDLRLGRSTACGQRHVLGNRQ
jgi:hypothetical protein